MFHSHVRPSLDEYYLQMLPLVASRSTCPRRQVGAILTDERGRVLSMGYNGVPAGMPHCIDERCDGANDPPGDTRRCIAIHAEMNALITCSRLDLIHTLYVSCTPCKACALSLCNTSLKRVVCREAYAEQTQILERCGVVVQVVDIQAKQL